MDEQQAASALIKQMLGEQAFNIAVLSAKLQVTESALSDAKAKAELAEQHFPPKP